MLTPMIFAPISEDAGDVAFIKDSTYESTCGPEVTPRPAWCLPQNQVRKLVDVGAVPSHMVVARAAGAGGRRALDQATIDKIRAGLIASMSKPAVDGCASDIVVARGCISSVAAFPLVQRSMRTTR
jgi:hypothetical protein